MPSLEMFRDRIRGVYPPNSIPNLNKHNNELNAVRRRPRTNSYHPSETKNYLISSVGDQEIFVLACHAQKVRVTRARVGVSSVYGVASRKLPTLYLWLA